MPYGEMVATARRSMTVGQALVSALGVLLWMAPAASWMTPTASATECTSRTEACPGRAGRPLHVPGEFRSVQDAIDAAPDGATILIAAGVFHESFRVEGKRLWIMGAEDGRTEISSPGRDIKLATYANGGGGELKGLFFQGGDCAVCGIHDGSSIPSALVVKDVTMADGYRGVFGGFSSLILKNVTVSGTQWHGMSVTHVGVELQSEDIEIHDTGGVGLLVFNGGPGDLDIGGHFHDNAKGGLEIIGHNGAINLVFVVADHNPEFGVFLFEANAGMTLSDLSSNGHSTPTGCHGAGLLVEQSSVVAVTGTVFSANCVGIYNSGSTVAIGSDIFDSNAADLGHEPGLPSSIDDLGNNVCGDNLGSPNETLHACQDLTLDLQPPSPDNP